MRPYVHQRNCEITSSTDDQTHSFCLDGLKTKRISFSLDLSREQFLNKLWEEFPEVAGVTFRLCKMGPNKKAVKLDEIICTPKDLPNHQQHRRSNIHSFCLDGLKTKRSKL